VDVDPSPESQPNNSLFSTNPVRSISDSSLPAKAVARAAINAVWYQKWLVHLRHRPESGGGLVQLQKTGPGLDAQVDPILLNSTALHLSHLRNTGSYLLSQAFPEGSPAHPAYPTGHGTVGGACITVLKFFFDGGAHIVNPLVPSADGLMLEPYNGADAGKMTVNGELHKLARVVILDRPAGHYRAQNIGLSMPKFFRKGDTGAASQSPPRHPPRSIVVGQIRHSYSHSGIVG
jgi:hypothetical protein